MNNVLIKSKKGIICGIICSLSAILLSNTYNKRVFGTVYDYFKINSYMPVICGGLVGFSYGYTGLPLYHFLYKKRSYNN
tara:strand:+ start:175 stop:411 length:237 start_codon:yes stop_codon:yes gene_type:complete